MERMLNKLKTCAGETLMESLASVLIFTMASILFLTMVTSASRINATAKEADQKLQADQIVLEEASSGSVKVVQVFVNGNLIDNTLRVSVASTASGELFAFYPYHSGG